MRTTRTRLTRAPAAVLTTVLVTVLLSVLVGCGTGAALHQPPAQWPAPGALDVAEPARPGSSSGPFARADAREVARYFRDSMEYLLRTSFNVQEMWLHQCGVCTDATRLYERSREDRVTYDFAEVTWEILEEYDGVPIHDDDPSTYWGFVVRLEVPELVVRDDRGRQVDVIPASSRVTDLVIGSYRRGWWLDFWRDVDADAA